MLSPEQRREIEEIRQTVEAQTESQSQKTRPDKPPSRSDFLILPGRLLLMTGASAYYSSTLKRSDDPAIFYIIMLVLGVLTLRSIVSAFSHIRDAAPVVAPVSSIGMALA